jgi:hypothetical protein
MSPTAGQLPGADNPKSPLVNANICLRFSISASIGGIPEYQETITASTDGFGMVNVVIGAVNPSGFAGISWVTGTKYLKVELDHTGLCTGSNTFSGVSEQPFTTVPFALYALNSGSGGGGGSTTTALTGDVSGSGTTGSITTTITNNAITTDKIANSSVTNAKLQNSSITINGSSIPLGGTATIAVTADAGTLTGTTLANTVVSSSLTTVGTLSNLTVTNTIAGSITGNAATVTTNADLSGDVKSIGNTTTIEPNAVTSSKILDGSIAVDDLGANAVTTVKLANDAVTTNKLADDAVENVKIKDAAVTYAKIQNISTSDKVLGRISTGSGVIEEIATNGTGDVVRANSPILSGTPSLPTGTTGVTQIASDNSTALATTAFVYNANLNNANLTGPITSVGNATTITDAAVNFTKIQNVNTDKVLGRISTGAGVIEEIATTGTGDVVRANSPTLNGIITINGNLNTSLNSTIGGTLGVTGATTIGGATKINSVQEYVSATTAALIVDGGVGIAKKLNIGGTTSAVDIIASGTLGVTGNFAVDTNKFTVDATNGNTNVAGTLNAGSIQSTPIGSTTASTGDFTTLATINDATIGGALDVTGATTIGGTTKINSVQEYVSATTAALIVDGGVGIAKNLNVGGKINVKEIVDSSPNRINNNTAGFNEITVNAMSGRFRFPATLVIPTPAPSPTIPSNTLRVKNSNVNSNSIIICNISSDTNTNNSILSVTSYSNYFEVKLVFSQDLNINFLVIN